MKKDQVIIMADVIGSSSINQGQLMEDFAKVVNEINETLKDALLSPLTITLGDEFQGITKGVKQAITVIQTIDEGLIRANKGFKLRYVVVEGAIDTPINKEIAYGMLGDGLTRARKEIESLKKSDHRFYFNLKDKSRQDSLNNLFIALQSIMDDWKPEKDYYLVSSFLKYKDYKQVAAVLEKGRSLIWKRKKNLKIGPYNALKEVANFIGGNHA